MRRKSLYLIVLVLASKFCLVTSANSSPITIGDFSAGTLGGFSTEGSVSITDYGHIPTTYTNEWDLSDWNSQMDGYFALLGKEQGSLHTKVKSLGTHPVSLSFDYAVAWSNPNPSPSPVYGYAVISTSGIGQDGTSIGDLSYNEITWGYDSFLSADVLAGTFYTDNFIIRTVAEDVQQISLSINLYGPDMCWDGACYQPINHIFAIDNINLDLSSPMPAPVPEASTMLLLGSGLACLAALRRKFQK